MKMQTKYIVDGNTTVEVIEVGEYLVPAANLIYESKDYTLYESKLDVMYAKLLRDLANGKSLENFRSSKYYSYYVDRLKEENPEYYL